MSDDSLILVTGGGGFIGSNIANRLAASGRRVVVADWFEDGEKWKNIAAALLHDLIRPEALPEWLADNASRIEAIVHMGAISATTERDVDKIVSHNIRLSLDLWQFASETGATFLYASSAATYGDGSRGFSDDDSVAGLASLAPLNPYGWSKHFVDRRIAADVAAGAPTPPKWAGLKFFNVYGPNEAHKGGMRSVVHQLYPQVLSGAPVRLFKSDHPDYADGGQLRDFIYVEDCVRVVEAMLAADQLAGVYNVGTGKARSFADLARAVFAALGREPNIEYIDMPEALKGRYQYFTEADTRKLSRDGLAPNFYSLEDGVRDYVEKLRSGAAV